MLSAAFIVVLLQEIRLSVEIFKYYPCIDINNREAKAIYLSTVEVMA